MNLVIDIGNTRTKVAIFNNENEIFFHYIDSDVKKTLNSILFQYPEIKYSIVANTKDSPAEIIDFLSEKTYCYDFNDELKIPIENNYSTPETLGKDRLAAAVGAFALFPNRNSLIIDAGTCITIDLVDEKNIYQGGAILLGIQKKAEALHTFTEKLPLINLNLDEKTEETGKTTIESISSGVLNGTLFEVKGFIEYYKHLYKDLNIILSGGDVNYFDKCLNFRKFVQPNLVLIGLNKILNFNAKE